MRHIPYCSTYACIFPRGQKIANAFVVQIKPVGKYILERKRARTRQISGMPGSGYIPILLMISPVHMMYTIILVALCVIIFCHLKVVPVVGHAGT